MSHALLPDVRTYIPIAPQANTLGESDEGQALYARHCPCQVLEVTGGCLEHSPYPTQSNHSTSYLSTPPPIYSPSRLCSRLLSSTQPHAYDLTSLHSTALHPPRPSRRTPPRCSSYVARRTCTRGAMWIACPSHHRPAGQLQLTSDSRSRLTPFPGWPRGLRRLLGNPSALGGARWRARWPTPLPTCALRTQVPRACAEAFVARLRAEGAYTDPTRLRLAVLPSGGWCGHIFRDNAEVTRQTLAFFAETQTA